MWNATSTMIITHGSHMEYKKAMEAYVESSI